MDKTDQLLLLLVEYVSDQKMKHIQELLKTNADPNTTDSYGNRPIHLAVLHSPSNSKLVLELIAFGAHLNVVNKYGTTPLMFSVLNRCHETSEILIKRGADLDFQSQRGWTALMLASMLGDARHVKMLLMQGASANICDTHKKTALMFACEGNYLNVIKELLEYGANPGLRDSAHRTALHKYMKKSRPRLDVIMKLLLHCASFSDLECNPEVSFLKMINTCLKEEQHHACLKTIIKIQMLLSPNYTSLSKFEDLYNFAMSCCAEGRFMVGFKVSRCTSVRHLLQKCLGGYMPTENELEALLPFVANNSFPIYSDVLRALIRKSFLTKKFLNMPLYAKQGYQDKITLYSDINCLILPYLSDKDVSNFVMAFYVKFAKEYRNHLHLEDCSMHPNPPYRRMC